MHAPPAGVSVETHITELLLVPWKLHSIYLSVYLSRDFCCITRPQWLHRQNMWIVIFFLLRPGLCSSVSCLQGGIGTSLLSLTRKTSRPWPVLLFFFPSKSTFLTCRNRCSVIAAKPTSIWFLRTGNRPASTFLPFSSECSYFLTCVGC